MRSFSQPLLGVMKTRWRFPVLVLAFASAALPASAVIDRVIDKTFAAQAGLVVSADTFSGGIRVKASDEAQVRVLVRQTVEAEDEKAAQALLAQLDVRLDQLADGAVRLKITPRHAVRWTWQNWSPAVLEIELTVPRTCVLRVRTGEGAIQVDSLRGDIVADTARGAIFIGEVDGDIVAGSGRGDVAVTACSGTLQLETKNGSLLVGRCGGPAQLLAVDGTIDVQAAKGPIFARGNRADIKVSFLPSIRATSDLESFGGDVTVGLDPACAVSIDARSSPFGRVRIRDLDIETSEDSSEKSNVAGTLNRGGPTLKIRASGGNVRLNRVPAL
jgi:hypothetical protein